MNLTPQGSQIIEELAQRYQVSVDAVTTLLQAVINGGGTMAQFSHPELGGSGQWMQGGMTMVGDMFNQALKARVDGLCCELAQAAANTTLFAQAEWPAAPGAASFNLSNAGGGHWWPGDLGMPASSGAQNHVRYAVFPQEHRLALDIDGRVTVYDTLNHEIWGVGQQQGSDASLTFTSQWGTIRIADLPVVPDPGAVPPPPPPAPSYAPASPPPFVNEDDIFAKIERLAELKAKGILSEEEFAAKKAELLNRI
ncbi:Short C-terminal domain-containing protein [Methylomagnum ishizawai]|uniref:Short C-terminal domain-containing protein n=1 Tax=Methylomagnum ishizawai TaxID=1760988 RepID=A0A1Y6D915_9GAMM|nr:SHOCT domain-containing protein [Methylomagnum ishizawai]SMF97213.1 Short C-terminal domain-containing protein [Methylomagnum ishizawai]